MVGAQALYARAVGGGEERALFDGVRFRTFFVAETGIYYLTARADTRPGGELCFFDLASVETPPYSG